MKIEKPIFIVGSGRSGTTILYNLLSTHPDVCWFSDLAEKYSCYKQLVVLHRILDIPLIGIRLKKKIIRSSGSRFSIKPIEGGDIYHSYCGFEHAFKTTEKDRNLEIEKTFKGLIKQHLQLIGKKRFLNKQTANTQRIRLINSMFQDAYYVHIIRDGRSVANSLFNVYWWNEVDIWWLGYTPATWQAMGKEPIELCALHWRKDTEELLENKKLFEDRYMEIRYEGLIEDVKTTLTNIADFCELNKSEKFTELLPDNLPNMNYKWKEELTDHQKILLNRILGDFLTQLGYKI